MLILNKIKENKKGILIQLLLILSSLFIGLFISIVHNSKISQAMTIQEGIAKEIIRFHVIANSDTKEDQELKVKVKNKVIIKMQELLADSKDINTTRDVILDNINTIEAIASEVIKENGYNYSIKVSLTKWNFPIKQYGDMIFPAGEYEALRIEIGEANGKNWWCVMFPSLCFVDATHGVVDDKSKEQLKNILTDEEYNSITKSNNKPIKVRFKIVDKIMKYWHN